MMNKIQACDIQQKANKRGLKAMNRNIGYSSVSIYFGSYKIFQKFEFDFL